MLGMTYKHAVVALACVTRSVIRWVVSSGEDGFQRKSGFNFSTRGGREKKGRGGLQ